MDNLDQKERREKLSPTEKVKLLKETLFSIDRKIENLGDQRRNIENKILNIEKNLK